MIKYRVFDAISGEYIVSVDSNNPNPSEKISITVGDEGDDRFVPIIRDWLEHEYGAFGHIIGTHTTPIDLDAAMHSRDSKKFRPEIVEGQELVKSYDPGIPRERLLDGKNFSKTKNLRRFAKQWSEQQHPRYWGKVSSDSESYALGLEEPLSIFQPPGIKLYQLKALKLRSFRLLLCCIQ